MKLPYDPAIPLLGIYPKENITQKTHAVSKAVGHNEERRGWGKLKG